MRRLAWLTWGLFALGCGGRVVGTIGPDAADAAPPQRGPSDGPAATDVAPPPVDAVVVDLGRVPDAIAPVDAPVDRPITSIDAPPDMVVGTPCQVANNNCPAGSYCLSANCITGTCVVAPTSDQEAPVCGCDRLTYWNASIAAGNAASVRIDG